MSNTSTFVIIFSGTWFLVGAVFLIIGMAMLHSRRKKELNCTAKAYGKIVDIVGRQSRDSDGMSHFSLHPVLEYHIGGLTFIKESPYGSSRPKYAIGQTVEIFYNPEDYHEYYMAEDRLPRMIAVIFTAVGAAAISVAVISAVIILRYIP